jgi:hypothetical protein
MKNLLTLSIVLIGITTVSCDRDRTEPEIQLSKKEMLVGNWRLHHVMLDQNGNNVFDDSIEVYKGNILMTIKPDSTLVYLWDNVPWDGYWQMKNEYEITLRFIRTPGKDTSENTVVNLSNEVLVTDNPNFPERGYFKKE